MTSPRETVLCQYRYDPLDRLTSYALPDITERQRFYCRSRLATEIQGAMRYSIIQHGEQLLAQQRREGDAPDTTLLATDQQRSVLQALKVDHPRQPIAYSPYGHRPIESGLLSLLGFNGERPDSVTGCYLLGNGYRAFSPVLMRFNSPDNFSPFGKGGLNSYAYCLGDPVNKSDPSGHSILMKLLSDSYVKGVQTAQIDTAFEWLHPYLRERGISGTLGFSNTKKPQTTLDTAKISPMSLTLNEVKALQSRTNGTLSIGETSSGKLFKLPQNSVKGETTPLPMPAHRTNETATSRPSPAEALHRVVYTEELHRQVADTQRRELLAEREEIFGSLDFSRRRNAIANFVNADLVDNVRQ